MDKNRRDDETDTSSPSCNWDTDRTHVVMYIQTGKILGAHVAAKGRERKTNKHSLQLKVGQTRESSPGSGQRGQARTDPPCMLQSAGTDTQRSDHYVYKC